MKRIIGLGILVLIVIVGWTGAWFWGAGEATKYVKSLETADGVSAPRVTCARFEMSGFPFGYGATCTGATIVSNDVTVTVAGLKAAVEIDDPFHLLFFAQSPVTLGDAFTGSQSRVDFASAEASAKLTNWRIGRISAVVEAPVWNDTVLEDRLIAKAAHLEAHVLDIPAQHDATRHLAAVAEYLKLDGLDAPGFAINAGDATLDAETFGLPDDVRLLQRPDALQQWQAAGGKLTLKDVKSSDGESFFNASGTLGLDSAGRVEGQARLHSKGVVERLGTLVPEQLKGLLLGGQADDGSYSQTVNVRAGIVFSGIVPAAVIPPLY